MRKISHQHLHTCDRCTQIKYAENHIQDRTLNYPFFRAEGTGLEPACLLRRTSLPTRLLTNSHTFQCAGFTDLLLFKLAIQEPPLYLCRHPYTSQGIPYSTLCAPIENVTVSPAARYQTRLKNSSLGTTRLHLVSRTLPHDAETVKCQTVAPIITCPDRYFLFYLP